MRKGRFSQEQIIAILRKQEVGMATTEVCRRHGGSSATFCAWKVKYCRLEVSETKRDERAVVAGRKLLRNLLEWNHWFPAECVALYVLTIYVNASTRYALSWAK